MYRVYDTKYISAMHPLCRDVKMSNLLSIVPFLQTSLENLALWARQPYLDTRFQLCSFSAVREVLIVALHHRHIRYGVHEQQHEAGYDAFLTARVFLALAAEMSGHGRDDSASVNGSILPLSSWTDV